MKEISPTLLKAAAKVGTFLEGTLLFWANSTEHQISHQYLNFEVCHSLMDRTTQLTNLLI